MSVLDIRYKGKLYTNEIGEALLVKDYRFFETKWSLGTIIRKLENTGKEFYIVWIRHANQLLKNNADDVYLTNANLYANHTVKM